MLFQGEEHPRQHAAGTSRGSSHNTPHGCIALANCHGVNHCVHSLFPQQAHKMLTHGSLNQSLGIATGQATVGAHAGEAVLHGFFHHLEHILHLGQ